MPETMISTRYPALILVTVLAPTCFSWTFSTTNINLAYPPPINYGYAAENDTAVGPNAIFPCADIPVDPSQSWVPFPISDGAFTYALSNTSIGSFKDYEYIVDVYIGQISLSDGTYSSSENINGGFADADTEVWKEFATGQQCSNDF